MCEYVSNLNFNTKSHSQPAQALYSPLIMTAS